MPLESARSEGDPLDHDPDRDPDPDRDRDRDPDPDRDHDRDPDHDHDRDHDPDRDPDPDRDASRSSCQALPVTPAAGLGTLGCAVSERRERTAGIAGRSYFSTRRRGP